MAKVDPASAWPYQLGMTRDSRGLVYALLGRYAEAAADFQVYIDELADTTDPEFIAEREQRIAWVGRLLSGAKPFTPEVLAERRGR